MLLPERLATALPAVWRSEWDLCLLGWSARADHDERAWLNDPGTKHGHAMPGAELLLRGARLGRAQLAHGHGAAHLVPVRVFYRTHAYLARGPVRGLFPLGWEVRGSALDFFRQECSG